MTTSFILQFNEEKFIMRDKRTHLSQCDTLENDEGNRDQNSKTFAVNCRSALLQLDHFDFCGGAFIPDVMHDVLEGTLQYESKLIIQHIITEKLLSYAKFADLLNNLELGYMEEDNRPSSISLRTITCNEKTLGQKGRIIM